MREAIRLTVERSLRNGFCFAIVLVILEIGLLSRSRHTSRYCFFEGEDHHPIYRPSMPFFRSSEGGFGPRKIEKTASLKPFPVKAPSSLLSTCSVVPFPSW